MPDTYLLRSSSSVDRPSTATSFGLGDRVVIARTDTTTSGFAVMRKFVYECTTAGITSGTTHAFSQIAGGTSSDGTVVWTARECTTWANAARYADYIATRLVAGDRLFVSQNHAETSTLSGTISITFPGTIANPCYFICVDDSIGGDTPTTIATGATITTTGPTHLNLNGSVHGYGISFSAATGAGGGNLSVLVSASAVQRWTSCNFISGTTSGANTRLSYSGGGATSVQLYFTDCWFKASATATRIDIGGFVRINGGGIYGTVFPPTLFGGINSTSIDFIATGFDMSACSSTVNLFLGGGWGTRQGQAIFRNCKVPSSWSGGLLTTAITNVGTNFAAFNIDSGDTNHTIYTADFTAAMQAETTIVRASGASDGVTSLSWKIITTTNCNAGTWYESPEIHRRVSAVGSPVTVTVEILHDSTTALKNDEIWLEVKYLGNSGFPLGKLITDYKADYFAANADQATSSATWTTTGLTNPNRQKLEVTIIPQEAGYIIAKVFIAKTLYTVYVDPKLAVA